METSHLYQVQIKDKLIEKENKKQYSGEEDYDEENNKYIRNSDKQEDIEGSDSEENESDSEDSDKQEDDSDKQEDDSDSNREEKYQDIEDLNDDILDDEEDKKDKEKKIKNHKKTKNKSNLPLPPNSEISTKGKPLPHELRKRIMMAIQRGERPINIAKQLMVGRATVYRLYNRHKKTGEAVPPPLPAGGYRGSLLDADLIMFLANKAVENPKLTAAELLEIAIQEKEVTTDYLNIGSIYRALHKAGLRYGKLQHWDEKTQSNPLIALERRCFEYHQQNDSAFDYNKLFYMDESIVRLHEQVKHGWGGEGEWNVIGKPKGMGSRLSIIVTIGPPDFLHYSIFKSQREYEAKDYYMEWDFEVEEKGHDIPKRFRSDEKSNLKVDSNNVLSDSQIRRSEDGFLRDVLKYFGVRWTNNEGKSVDRDELIKRVLHIKNKGRVGLLKAGRKEVGGKSKPPIHTALDVVRYFREDLKPFMEKYVSDYQARSKINSENNSELKNTTSVNFKNHRLVLDNASIHGAPAMNQPKVKSFLQEEITKQLKMRGVIFTPPRSPDKNPVELIFSLLKRYVRKVAPPQGFTEDSLIETIHKGFEKIKKHFRPNKTSLLSGLARKCHYKTDIVHNLKHQSTCGVVKDQEKTNTNNNNNNNNNNTNNNTNNNNNTTNVCNIPSGSLPKKGRFICATSNGTVIKEKRPGKTDWRFVSKNPQLPTEKLVNLYPGQALYQKTHPSPKTPLTTENINALQAQHRYPGYGKKTLETAKNPWRENLPKSFQAAIVAGDNYAVHAIVDERTNDEKKNMDYLMYWTDGSRSWINETDLTAGATALKQQWKTLKRKRLMLSKTQQRLKEKQIQYRPSRNIKNNFESDEEDGEQNNNSDKEESEQEENKNTNNNKKKNKKKENKKKNKSKGESDNESEEDSNEESDSESEDDQPRYIKTTSKQKSKTKKHSQNESLYAVEKLLKYDSRNKSYLVRWKPSKNKEYQNTWEPEKNITNDLIQDFWKKK